METETIFEKIKRFIKIILAILLLICLLDLPYCYFQFVRFASLIGFGILAYHANSNNKQTEVIIYIILAVLFQPFIKISLGRELWNIVDVIVAVALLISLFLRKDKVES
jgi:hypothetical protein